MAAAPRTGSLLFLPVRWQRVAVLKWLKRVHGWTGLWGAALFLLLGISGVLLNHRSILKIDTGAPVEVGAIDVAIPRAGIADPDALARWAKGVLALPVEGRAPPPEPKIEQRFMGRALPQPERWTRVFNLTGTRITVDYVPGAPSARVTRDAVGVLGTVKNLHKGVGLGVAWVLLIDTIAGALIAMSVTGVMLWSRLQGPRMLAVALASASLAWAAAAAL